MGMRSHEIETLDVSGLRDCRYSLGSVSDETLRASERLTAAMFKVGIVLIQSFGICRINGPREKSTNASELGYENTHKLLAVLYLPSRGSSPIDYIRSPLQPCRSLQFRHDLIWSALYS